MHRFRGVCNILQSQEAWPWAVPWRTFLLDHLFKGTGEISSVIPQKSLMVSLPAMWIPKHSMWHTLQTFNYLVLDPTLCHKHTELPWPFPRSSGLGPCCSLDSLPVFSLLFTVPLSRPEMSPLLEGSFLISPRQNELLYHPIPNSVVSTLGFTPH